MTVSLGDTDLLSYRVKVTIGNIPVDVPLISHIEDNLWMGGCLDVLPLPDDFKFVVSLHPWARYAIAAATVRLESELQDKAEIPSQRGIIDLGRIVNAFRASGKTLVHCQAGLNRSGLVTAMALIHAGRTPSDAIHLLRSKRCSSVLFNKHFEHWLLSWEYGNPLERT